MKKFYDASLMSLSDASGKLNIFALAVPIFFQQIFTLLLSTVNTVALMQGYGDKRSELGFIYSDSHTYDAGNRDFNYIMHCARLGRDGYGKQRICIGYAMPVCGFCGNKRNMCCLCNAVYGINEYKRNGSRLCRYIF